MSRLDELIAKLCPDGIESIPMGSIMTRIRERGKDAPNVTQVYAVSNTMGMVRAEDFRDNTIHSEDTSNYTVIREGMVAYNPSRLNIGSIAMLKTNLPGLVSPMYVVFSINENLVSREYFDYLMHSSYVANKIDSFKEEGARFRFDFSRWNWIMVQIPPKEVQAKIVHMLNYFKQLSSELSVELSARRKQYEYYRNQMLSFDTDVQRIPMGDLFEFRNGLSKGKEFFGRGTPFIRYTDVYNHRSLRKDNIDALVECTPDELRKLKVSRGDVLFTRTSETAEDVGWSSVMLDDMDNCVFNGFTIKASPKTDLLWPEYCAYCFATDSFRNYVTKHCAFTTRASLTGSTIADYILAVPSLAVQKRIAEVLDNFEKICNDLSSGLPAEIEARQKQYEYYRDKLLTFKEKA